jgi:hypothetical protein
MMERTRIWSGRSKALSLLSTVVVACSPQVVSVATDAGSMDAGALTPLPDLRFKYVGVSSVGTELCTNVTFAQGAGMTATTRGGLAWSPFELDMDDPLHGDYSWETSQLSLPTATPAILSMTKSGSTAGLDADLTLDQGVVVSLDITSDAYVFATQKPLDDTGNEIYDSRGVVDVLRAQLDGAVATEAAHGRVVTALSASPTMTGAIRVYSFGRSGDATAYQTSVVDFTPATLANQASELAAGGYTITASGRVGVDAGILVGTRSPGAAARSITTQMLTPTSPCPDVSGGAAIVAWIAWGGGPSFQSLTVLER